MHLPGVGRKSATRFAYTLLENPSWMEELATVLTELRNRLRLCSYCANYTEEDPCPLCRKRSHSSTLCVVAYPTDIPVIERSGAHQGGYLVLHGLLDPVRGKTLKDLQIPLLKKRLEEGSIEEVILALHPTQEGEITARFLVDLLSPYPVRVTRLALGIPLGSSLEFLDDHTLSVAFRNRQPAEKAPSL